MPRQNLYFTGVLVLLILAGSLAIAALYLPALRPAPEVALNLPAPTPAPTPIQLIPQWKIFANAEFAYSIQYPPEANPVVKPASEVYRHFVSFEVVTLDDYGEEVARAELFSLTVRTQTLEEEVQFQRDRLEKHTSAPLVNKQEFSHQGNPAVRLDYAPASPSGALSLVVLRKPPWAFTLYFPHLSDPSFLTQVLSTLYFLP